MGSTGQDREFSDVRAWVSKALRHRYFRVVRRASRRVRRFVPNLWRRSTQRYRQLPGAVIVGAQKAGTTQLHACLIRHPRCLPGAAKEVQYFSRRRHLPVSWYRSRFPLARSVARVGGLCMEATPSYLPSPPALRMMGEVLPDAKVIVLLRDPVARAFSHYQHYKTRGLESRTFPEVVRDAIDGSEYLPVHGAALGPDAPPMLDYVARGYYALQLEVLFDEYPREQVLIVDSADLFDDTNAVCQRVFDFLGLERHDVSPKRIHNRGYYREGVDDVTAERLRRHYRPYDELLVELLGQPFRWMTPAGQTVGADADHTRRRRAA